MRQAEIETESMRLSHPLNEKWIEADGNRRENRKSTWCEEISNNWSKKSLPLTNKKRKQMHSAKWQSRWEIILYSPSTELCRSIMLQSRSDDKLLICSGKNTTILTPIMGSWTMNLILSIDLNVIYYRWLVLSYSCKRWRWASYFEHLWQDVD